MKQNLFIKSLIITSALITFSAGTFSASAATISPTEVVSITSSWISVNTNLDSEKIGWVGHSGSAALSGGNLTITPDNIVFGNVLYNFNLTEMGASISEIETQGMTISFNSSADGGGFGFVLPDGDINPTFTQNTLTEGMNTLYIAGETAKTYFGTNSTQSANQAKDGYALLGITVANITGSPVTISNLQVSLGQAIPEPSSVGLLAGAGMFALVGLRRRKH